MSRVLVTGAAGGIGAETTRLLAQQGHHVIAADVREEELEATGAAETHVLDITDAAAVAKVVEQSSPVEVLVNTVGQGFWSPLEVTPHHELRRAFDLNVIGPLHVMQLVLSQMRAAGAGTVINLTSAAARVASPLTGLYSSSKAALDFLSRTARLETAKLGIKIMVVEPQFVETGFVGRRYYGSTDDEYYSGLIDACVESLQRRITSAPIAPVEVAKLIAALIDMDDPGYRWAIATTAAASLADGPVDDERERAFDEGMLRNYGLL